MTISSDRAAGQAGATPETQDGQCDGQCISAGFDLGQRGSEAIILSNSQCRITLPRSLR